MSDSIYLIYKHTSPSGKSYIGQTKNLSQRSNAHKIPSSKCIIFKNAIQKYNWETFTHEILAENLLLEEANKLEEYFIQEYNTIAPNGYNIRSGGLNHQWNNDTKIKMSNNRKGKSRTPEHQQKLNEAAKTRIRTPEHQAALLAAVSKPKTEEHKQNMSNSKKGIPKTEEHKQKISKTLTGTIQSEERKQKVALHNTGRRIYIDPISGKRKYRYPDSSTIFP